MSKFSTIEISRLVALHPHVEVHRFLGFYERVSYQPTHSGIESYRNFYAAPEAEVLQQIAEAEDPSQFLSSAVEMMTTDGGNYRLDLCMSHDCRFAAFQVFELKGEDYVPYSKLRFLEGDNARIFESLLA